MEKKTFKIIKNMLIPIKSTIEIGPEGITNKGRFVEWKNINEFSYSITSINKAMNYKIAYTDISGGNHLLNFIVTLAGSKKKKALFAEIYQMFHEGVTQNLIMPKAKEYAQQVRDGQEASLAGTTINKEGITVPRVMKRKQTVHIPWDKIELVHRDGSGGFDVQSIENNKDRGYFQYEGTETRYLLATLEQLFPTQAQVYK